ncbi:putative cytochrome P450 monooxygenase [Aspergillus cavernicola]|uniref:Cytochrome P450 monooxygenase n=1 Tax=Aspergillus cavernicola TaxID=176166 RepID=A0ABR4I859_9EURO
MAIKISFIVATLTIAYFIYKLISFTRFYLHARRAGFPIFISPVFSKSIPWMILGPALEPQFKKYLPVWIHERLDIPAHGWEYRNKRAFHDRLGDVFTVVTPDECSVWVADPDLGNVILQRRVDFPQAPVVAQIMGFFGPNVFCANGDEWKRHRRMFAANLDERISRTVWTESCEQAIDMLKHMLDHPGNQTLDGLKSVAINVIGQAGYSQKEAWAPDLKTRSSKALTGKAAYFETLSLVTEMLIEAALLPPWFMQLGFMPAALRQLGYHMERTPGYINDLLNEERVAAGKETGQRNNFLSLLLQLSDKEKQSGQGQFSLSDREISGSLFIFSTAGFETTANTMGYAVTLLAAYPELQAWIGEELSSLDPDPSTWKYEEVFPKCRRTLALMLETLRLFPPVLHTTRAILETQTLVDSSGDHVLTPPMDVYVSQLSMHLDPRLWGPDANEFRPSRWIDEFGQIITPPKGTYIPWSGGPRMCPGLKMSQVEFVATLATLFRSARCEALPVSGFNTPKELRERLQRLTADSVVKLTVQMRDATGVELQWVGV